MMTIQLKVSGMSCGHCKKHVEDTFSNIPGVEEVQVSLEQENASIKFNKDQVSEAILRAALDGTTYTIEA